MTEVIGNSPTPGTPTNITTLASGTTSSQGFIVTTSPAPSYLQGGQFRVVIGSEILLIASGQAGQTWGAYRGVENSTGQVQSASALVYHTWTASGIVNVALQEAGAGAVDSVTAADTSIVVGGTGANPTIRTGTLDVIAADHPPASPWSNNSNKITSLANGSAASDAAAFGQIPTSASTIGGLLAANNLSDVTSASTSLTNLGGAPITSPTFKGTVTVSGNFTVTSGTAIAPTPTTGNNSNQIATTAYVLTTISGGAFLQPGNNLSDVDDPGSSRLNIHVAELAACQAAATTNVTLSGLQTIDGHQTLTNDLVLCTAQSNGAQNGPWITSAGNWTRPHEYASGASIVAGRTVTVVSGTVNGPSPWVLKTAGTVVVDSTATTWVYDLPPSVVLSNTQPLVISGTPAIGQIPVATSSTTADWTTASGSNAVSSVFGRTGAVTAQSGDYTAAQVGALPSTDDLSTIATTNATAGNVSLNSHKITNLANGSASSDAAAFGQIPTTAAQVGALPSTDDLSTIANTNATAGNVSLNSHKVTNLANGSASSDAAAFGQIPTSASTIGGLLAANNLSDVANTGTSRYDISVPVLTPVACVASGNVTTLSGLGTYDNYTLLSTDQILLAGQTTTSQNGLWQASAGNWTRPTEFPSGGIVKAKTVTSVSGSYYAGSEWILQTNTNVTIDTSGQVWNQLNAPRFTSGRTYPIMGAIVVAAGQTNYLPPFYEPVDTDVTKKLIKVKYVIASGINAVFSIQQNGTNVNGLGALTATTTPTITLVPIPPIVNDLDEFAPVITSISGTPYNMSITHVFETTQ